MAQQLRVPSIHMGVIYNAQKFQGIRCLLLTSTGVRHTCGTHIYILIQEKTLIHSK